MNDDAIHAELIEVGLQKVPGSDFERFVNAFYPAIAGVGFIPLGGTKDGGADAMLEPDTWVDSDSGVFYQASVQKDHRSKIRATIKRLKEYGRSVGELIYVTSQKLATIDTEERALGKETGVQIRIRDGAYLASHVNDTPQTRRAFRDFIGPHLEFLKHVGSAKSLGPSQHVRSPAVFVFLRQEIERRSGDRSLPEAVVDSLILWALEGTDPEKNLFKSGAEIRQQIAAEVPFAEPLLKAHLAKRLKQLSSKQNPTGREIRHHKREDVYCLPYETRLKVQEENATEEALRLGVLAGFEERIAKSGEIEAQDVSTVGELALRSVQLTFEREGLEFAAFLDNGDEARGYANIADSVDAALGETKVRAPKAELFKAAILGALRSALYSSSPSERLLLGKLSRTYSLFFGLKADPRIVNYFQDMASDFYLYVGSDLIVRSLSERYVRPEDQRVRTLLTMLAEAGATLVLAEPVLEEVMNHLRTTMFEYQNYFAGNEQGVTHELVRNSPKILIRAYFYAKLDPPPGVKSPSTWESYVQQFCTPDRIGRRDGMEELRRYLQSTFKMVYEARKDIENMVLDKESQVDLETITESLREHKAADELARNDALLTLAVYRRRHAKGEYSKATEFGYKTWWLTTETSILRYTKDIVTQRGSRYMMRPEFVLNFVALAPKLADVRKAYESVFPSLLGVRLANRVKEDVFRDMMTKIKAANDLEPGRREALIAQYSDQLKGDFHKVYDHNL